MLEHRTDLIIFNSSFDLMNKSQNLLSIEEKEGWELIQVVVIQNAAEAVIYLKRTQVNGSRFTTPVTSSISIEEALKRKDREVVNA